MKKSVNFQLEENIALCVFVDIKFSWIKLVTTTSSTYENYQIHLVTVFEYELNKVEGCAPKKPRKSETQNFGIVTGRFLKSTFCKKKLQEKRRKKRNLNVKKI